MTRMEAYEYLRALLDGVDPLTGEILPPDHVCCDENVLEAMEMATKALCSMKDEWFGMMQPKSDRHVRSKPVRQVEPEEAPAGTDPRWVKKNGKLNASRPWTAADCARLKQLFFDGAEIDEICIQLQRRRRGVETMLYELGLIGASKLSRPSKPKTPGLEKRGMPWLPEDDSLLRVMYEHQRPIDEMARALQRSDYAVYCHMERLGMTGDVDGYPMADEMDEWTDDEMMLLRGLHERGYSAEEIAAELERPLPSVRGRLFALGLSREAPFSLRQKK